VEQKQGILESSLRGLRKLNDFKVLPLLAAEEEFNYRNRIQIQVRGGKFGFFAKGTNDLVEVRECWISDPEINVRLRALTAADAAGATRVELALLQSGGVSAVGGRRAPEIAVFAQVNRAQNEVLKSHVLAAIHGRPQWIFDLYAGSGNLTEPLAAQFVSSSITAVELSRSAVERATVRADWRVGDVGKVLAQMAVPPGDGLIVLDPPRNGCETNVTDQLIRFRPKQIVYVSCNPSTFARDAERMVKSGLYALEAVQGLDMFPQTEHVELIASLVRR
jgi:23S rRNA (uracil1939-C5)-methyltransferase